MASRKVSYLYRGTWPDTTDNVEFSIEPFKFTSRANLTNTPVQTAITVSTYLDSGERIWGGAVINIGEDTQVDTFYVKASFDKETFSAGDTLSVSFVKVDKNGNVSSFPAGTLYEVRVDEGCTVGKLLIAGERGSYFKDVSMPLQFIVNDSLETADSVISVKVGVPGDDGSVYLSNQSRAGLEKQNVKLSSKLKSVTNANSVCSTAGFTYVINANAVAKAGGDCGKKENECVSNEIPKQPTFNFVHGESVSSYCEEPPTVKDGYTYYNIAGLLIRSNPIEGIIPTVCYNKTLEKWIIKVNDSNTLDIKFDSYWCEDNMIAQWPNLIQNMSALESIPPEKICKALEDLVKQRNLNRKGTIYALQEVIGEHEVQHLSDYKNIADTVQTLMNFHDKFIDLSKGCEQINSKADLIKDTDIKIRGLINEFELKLYKKNKSIIGEEDEFRQPNARMQENERKTQSKAFTVAGKKYMIRLYERGVELGQKTCVEKLKNQYPGLFKI